MEGVNVQRSLHPQYHDWGALEQGTEPPTAPRVLQHWLPTALGVCSVCVQCVCVCVCVCLLLTAMCVHLDGLNAEHKFQVWEVSFPIFLYVNAQSGGVWERGRNGISSQDESQLSQANPSICINDWLIMLCFYHFRELYSSWARHLWTGPASERVLPRHRPLAARLHSECRLRRGLWPRGPDLTGASHPAVGRPRHQVPPQLWPLQPGELSSHPHRLREWEQVWRRIRWEKKKKACEN